jgi:hypothetical protein
VNKGRKKIKKNGFLVFKAIANMVLKRKEPVWVSNTPQANKLPQRA